MAESGGARSPLCWLEAALGDAEFQREILPAIGDEWLRRSRLYAEAHSGAYSARQFASQMNLGWVPTDAAAHPLMASVLWLARRPMTLHFSGIVPDSSVSLLLRAGRRSLARIELFGGACFVPAGEARAAFAPMRHCQRLRSVLGTQIPGQYADHLAAVVAEHAPASLTTLALEFLPPFMGTQPCGWGREGGRGHGPGKRAPPLPGTLTEVTLVGAGFHFRHGLAAILPCATLTSLTLDLDDACPDDDDAAAAALADMLPRLAALRALTLQNAMLTAPAAGALSALAELRTLVLSAVFAAEAGPVAAALRKTRLPRLEALSVNEALYRDRARPLAALLQGVADSSPDLASLRIRLPAGTIDLRHVIPALAACASAAPLRKLHLDAYRHRDAVAVAVVRAAAGAAGTLRELDLNGLQLTSRELMGAAFAALATCRRLERLEVDCLSHRSCPSPDACLSELVATVASRAPQLREIRSRCIGQPSALELLQTSQAALRGEFRSTVEAVRRLQELRRQQASARAWAVVRAGLESQQERRVRGGPAGSGGIARLPASVLRALDLYAMDLPVALRVG